jgi:hypothetical protein
MTSLCLIHHVTEREHIVWLRNTSREADHKGAEFNSPCNLIVVSCISDCANVPVDSASASGHEICRVVGKFVRCAN